MLHSPFVSVDLLAQRYRLILARPFATTILISSATKTPEIPDSASMRCESDAKPQSIVARSVLDMGGGGDLRQAHSRASSDWADRANIVVTDGSM